VQKEQALAVGVTISKKARQNVLKRLGVIKIASKIREKNSQILVKNFTQFSASGKIISMLKQLLIRS
jgi:hypothetical protein